MLKYSKAIRCWSIDTTTARKVAKIGVEYQQRLKTLLMQKTDFHHLDWGQTKRILAAAKKARDFLMK
mgnify:CR=1 FL=1